MSTSESMKSLVNSLKAKFKNVRVMGVASDIINKYPVYSTGILDLDKVIGNGGIMATKCYELYGAESGGKSLILYKIIASVINAGKLVLLYDAERSSDSEETKAWMQKQGIDLDRLLYIRDTAETAMNILHMAALNPDVGLIAIDSISWMTTEAEFERGMDEQEVAEIARKLPKFLRKFTTITEQAALVVINQARDKIGGPPAGYATVTHTMGGRALRHCMSVRIEVTPGIRLYDDAGAKKKKDIGLQINFRNIKNKLAVPRKRGQCDFYWETGVDTPEQLVRLALENDLFKVSGSWLEITLNNKVFNAQSKDKMKDALKADPAAVSALSKLILTTTAHVVGDAEADRGEETADGD